MGMTDIKTFRVEGVKVPGLQETALDKAIQAIEL
jgi:FMN-dependent NADH-azoreductase